MPKIVWCQSHKQCRQPATAGRLYVNGEPLALCSECRQLALVSNAFLQATLAYLLAAPLSRSDSSVKVKAVRPAKKGRAG